MLFAKNGKFFRISIFLTSLMHLLTQTGLVCLHCPPSLTLKFAHELPPKLTKLTDRHPLIHSFIHSFNRSLTQLKLNHLPFKRYRRTDTPRARSVAQGVSFQSDADTHIVCVCARVFNAVNGHYLADDSC